MSLNYSEEQHNHTLEPLFTQWELVMNKPNFQQIKLSYLINLDQKSLVRTMSLINNLCTRAAANLL